ncbi:SYF2 splicing factor [Rhizoctonia solani]|uniref:Pre-mRNA-splicing factor SYF2 n=1 Tax=Rhizoctonia solani TaxID=456999 RepID=A0A8H7HDU4_9AGAM|nr:SYF2 splicing factor [Rhizoctonia solani]KAF8758958.1 SYF2 splicing factor [Rhizoctonia solani]
MSDNSQVPAATPETGHKDVSPEVHAESGGSDSGGEDAVDSEGKSGSATPLTESSTGGKATIEERAARMEALRAKMVFLSMPQRESTAANRKDLIAEHNKAKFSVKEAARLEKQRRLAETLRESMDAEERGEDMERKKNWDYSIEENDEWEKRQARKERRADFQFHDDAHAARRKYKKDLDLIKPDLAAYQAQKEAAMSQGSALQNFSSGSSSNAVTASEQLYRDANTLLYGDNKPSEEAIDRVVGKLNHDLDKRSKFSRKRNNEEEGDITYINERNRVFNKKIARFYDKYTAETRASFERGTAL